MTGRDDRRESERKASRLRVWADPGGTAPATDCVVVDISEGGALLSPIKPTKLPSRFSLQRDGTTKMSDAEVVWRGNGMIGVRFSAA
jgi:hypothetical protein